MCNNIITHVLLALLQHLIPTISKSLKLIELARVWHSFTLPRLVADK